MSSPLLLHFSLSFSSLLFSSLIFLHFSLSLPLSLSDSFSFLSSSLLSLYVYILSSSLLSPPSALSSPTYLFQSPLFCLPLSSCSLGILLSSFLSSFLTSSLLILSCPFLPSSRSFSPPPLLRSSLTLSSPLLCSFYSSSFPPPPLPLLSSPLLRPLSSLLFSSLAPSPPSLLLSSHPHLAVNLWTPFPVLASRVFAQHQQAPYPSSLKAEPTPLSIKFHYHPLSLLIYQLSNSHTPQPLTYNQPVEGGQRVTRGASAGSHGTTLGCIHAKRGWCDTWIFWTGPVYAPNVIQHTCPLHSARVYVRRDGDVLVFVFGALSYVLGSISASPSLCGPLVADFGPRECEPGSSASRHEVDGGPVARVIHHKYYWLGAGGDAPSLFLSHPRFGR
ncbi:hypothetical protein C7M84_024933 [Penaeus vannamei]|uniref:Uncharacterized protein n=1 Tax=Penaeus vannamei TaxID=6689 RepID=A0A423TZP7_PENVA|nr:hypothetical protein C7M84_024933 [Penaeus vannamei]